MFTEEGIICKQHKRSMYQRQKSAQRSYLQERDIYTGHIAPKKQQSRNQQESVVSMSKAQKQNDSLQGQKISIPLNYLNTKSHRDQASQQNEIQHIRGVKSLNFKDEKQGCSAKSIDNFSQARDKANQTQLMNRSEDDSTIDPEEEETMKVNFSSNREKFSNQDHQLERNLICEVNKKEQKAQSQQIPILQDSDPGKKVLSFEFELDKLISNQLGQAKQGQQPSQTNQIGPSLQQNPQQSQNYQSQQTNQQQVPINYQNTIGHQNNYYFIQPTQQYIITNPVPVIQSISNGQVQIQPTQSFQNQLQSQISTLGQPNFINPPQSQLNHGGLQPISPFGIPFPNSNAGGLGAALIGQGVLSGPIHQSNQIQSSNFPSGFVPLSSQQGFQGYCHRQKKKPELVVNMKLNLKSEKKRLKTQNFNPPVSSDQLNIPTVVIPQAKKAPIRRPNQTKPIEESRLLEENIGKEDKERDKSKKEKKKKKCRKEKPDGIEQSVLSNESSSKMSNQRVNSNEKFQRKREIKAANQSLYPQAINYSTANATQLPSRNQLKNHNGNQQSQWWRQLQRTKSRKREPYNKTQKMRTVSREEDRLQNIQVDWNNYKIYFSKVTKNDMDYVEYHMVGKPLSTKILVEELIEIEKDPKLIKYKEEMIQELKDQNDSKIEEIKDKDQEQNYFNAFLENQDDGSVSLIFFKEKLSDNISKLQYYDQYSNNQPESEPSGLGGGLSGCVQLPPLPSLNFDQQSQKKLGRGFELENQFQLTQGKQPESEQQQNFSSENYYLHNYFTFPPEAKEYVSLLKKRNKSLVYSYEEMVKNRDLQADELTCMILANNYLHQELLEDIKVQKDRLMKNIRRQKSDHEDQTQRMKSLVSPYTLQLLFNQTLETEDDVAADEQVMKFNSQDNHSDHEDHILQDETSIFDSAFYCERSSSRAQNIWSWQTVYRTFELSFSPPSIQLDLLLKDPFEVPYACMCCFLSIYDNLNQIVYCELCDGGVHQRCYGIEDLDEPFYCDLCLQRKKRQDLDQKKKEKMCYICQKSGCMMKIDSSFKKNENTYFHPFCIFTTSSTYYKNIHRMKGLGIDHNHILNSNCDDQNEEVRCDYCDKIQRKDKGVLEYCAQCNQTKFHSMCAWVKGCEFQIVRKGYNKTETTKSTEKQEDDPMKEVKEQEFESLIDRVWSKDLGKLKKMDIKSYKSFSQVYYREAYGIRVDIICKKCKPIDQRIREIRIQKYQQIEKNLAEMSAQKQKEIEDVQRKLFKDIDESSGEF